MPVMSARRGSDMGFLADALLPPCEHVAQGLIKRYQRLPPGRLGQPRMGASRVHNLAGTQALGIDLSGHLDVALASEPLQDVRQRHGMSGGYVEDAGFHPIEQQVV